MTTYDPTRAAIELAFTDGGIDNFDTLPDIDIDNIARDFADDFDLDAPELAIAMRSLRDAMPILRMLA